MLRRCVRGVRQLTKSNALAIQIDSRTGDTSATNRAAWHAQPPHILLTPPETLALLLSRPDAVDLFRNVRWLVIDEVHALAPTKRGADLALSLERVQALAEQNLRRIGLSATCSPTEE